MTIGACRFNGAGLWSPVILCIVNFQVCNFFMKHRVKVNNYDVLPIIKKGQQHSEARGRLGESNLLSGIKKTTLLFKRKSCYCSLSSQAACGPLVAVKSLSFCRLNFVILSARECGHLKGTFRSLHPGQICINRFFLLSVHLPSCPWSHPWSVWNHRQRLWGRKKSKRGEESGFIVSLYVQGVLFYWNLRIFFFLTDIIQLLKR